MSLPQDKRPSITLAIIAKNEAHNLPRLLDSVEGCFDEIIVADTGSTDGTVDIAKNLGAKVFHFDWINDFSAARNFAFSKATSDFIMWLDCDDVLFNREGFIKWRDHGMEFCDIAFNSYQYAVEFDEAKPWKEQELKPIVSFVRERVFKRANNPKWNYPLHEGIPPMPGWRPTYATTWCVKHLRSKEDMVQDRLRNINILDDMIKTAPLDGRMQFYYGKELHEIGSHGEAIRALEKALTMPQEIHDKTLALQYAAYSATAAFERMKDDFKEEKQILFNKILNFCHEGIKIDANRAEFYIQAGDLFIRTGQIQKALPYFAAAKHCIGNFDSPYSAPIYSFKNLYGDTPTLQLSKIYAHLGRLDDAKRYALESKEIYKNPEADQILSEIDRVSKLVKLDNDQNDVDDIVISCPPQTAYSFDEEMYKTKGAGGSETALIHVAKHLKKKTGRNVKVFNMRDSTLVAESGVEYIPAAQLNEYMSINRPHTHIAWRHNIKLTKSPTYLWAHDLTTPTIEAFRNFDKMLCLSEFHKDYTMAMSGVPEKEIIITRNGIDPDKFLFPRRLKNKNKVVWMSSPDRGLDRAMKVLDIVRKDHPDIELHVYYGLENLYKYGLSDMANNLKKMMDERPWVKYHGMTEQSKMLRDCSDAVIWLHPCDFIETYCITALEMLTLGIFPVTRSLGALKNTLAEAKHLGQAFLLDHDCITPQEHEDYARAVKTVLEGKLWERVSLDAREMSWEKVADDWIGFMNLKKDEAKVLSA